MCLLDSLATGKVIKTTKHNIILNLGYTSLGQKLHIKRMPLQVDTVLKNINTPHVLSSEKVCPQKENQNSEGRPQAGEDNLSLSRLCALGSCWRREHLIPIWGSPLIGLFSVPSIAPPQRKFSDLSD